LTETGHSKRPEATQFWFARRVEHPLAYFDNQAGFFGNWNEFERREPAFFGVRPAQKRFEADNLVRLGVDPGLIVQLEFVLVDRAAHFLLHRQQARVAHVAPRVVAA